MSSDNTIYVVMNIAFLYYFVMAIIIDLKKPYKHLDSIRRAIRLISFILTMLAIPIVTYVITIIMIMPCFSSCSDSVANVISTTAFLNLCICIFIPIVIINHTNKKFIILYTILKFLIIISVVLFLL